MNNYYTHRQLLTIWRRKSTLLIATLLLVVIVFGIQYNNKSTVNTTNAKRTTHLKSSANRDATVKSVKNGDEIAVADQAVVFDRRNFVKAANNNRNKGDDRDRDGKDQVQRDQEYEQRLGIPFVNLDPDNPYVPHSRLVHFDLKGAPPKIEYLKKIFRLVKNLGATGVLIEYEDMFPYEGRLQGISAKNSYTKKEIRELLDEAELLKLQVIPLIQTFGHVEFALKHKQFINIREVKTSPQALCPSRNESLEFVNEIVTQVLAMHANSKYLHIGCDEVFQIGECDLCRLESHENLFLRHVQRVADLVHRRHPNIRLIIWDDMLRHLSTQIMLDAQLGSYVEPMVWVYAEDIYRFVQPQVWEKYAAVFETAWTASAFKGAFGETLYVPNARRHLENNLRWLDVMSQQNRYFKNGFSGLVLTGWQRYDHFAVLCELLPASVPSLALSLLSVSNGYFNSSLRATLLNSLSCPNNNNINNNVPFVNLDVDPFLWEKLGRCMFPGSLFFRLTYRLNSMENEVIDFLKVTTRHKGWLTEYNVRHNYSLPLRVEELTSDLPRVLHGAVSVARSAYDTMMNVFDNYTISEWVEQRVYPYLLELERLQNQSNSLRNVNVWPARPLQPLADLSRFGVRLNV